MALLDLEELLEEVLLRLPPADPVSLVRAALVCKPWYHIVSDRRFRRRFREFHRSPPMLGLLLNFVEGGNCPGTRFVPATSFRPARANHTLCVARDGRHGRVLLHVEKQDNETLLVVWDPTTDEQWELPAAPLGPSFIFHWSAKVLCAATASGACDHLDCNGNPFIVVSVGTNKNGVTSLWVYSSEAEAWGEPTLLPNCSVVARPATLVGNTLYILTEMGRGVLMYDLATQKSSIAGLPLPYDLYFDTVLMTMEDGGLGVAGLDGHARLFLWSVEANPNGDTRMGCTQIRVIELDKLLPVDDMEILGGFLSFHHDVGVFFVGTCDFLFIFDPKSGRVSKACQEAFDDYDRGTVYSVVPYMSFYTPALRAAAASTSKGPSTGV